MGIFNVTYPNGRQAVETSNDCETVDAFISMKFGSAFNDQCKVTLVEDEESAPPAPKAIVKPLVKPKK